ncbi:probable caffeine synthase MTL2 [Humulus lupulus]|uniref:probable caffeine synthase MTL2 n=2 Tax=Humulus lupulus TaxID=3486 RepID=UPI002B40C69B|nr:probable caffeine synthase MTL2 [Humulus lupulus]XP_062102076.1 probable caffeine synthase MTL2 [Humulus lupulus]
MEVEQVPHMKGGVGKASYSNNSSLQKVVISKVKSTVEETALEVYSNILPECMRIGELGCSSGPTALTVTSYILDAIMSSSQFLDDEMNKKKPLTFQVFLNDLPGNDFNTLFQLLSSFYERLKNKNGDKFKPLCFVMAMPGSFHGRLFPNNSMHTIHSSNSLHWLSKVPNGLVSETGEAHNKDNIYITKTSPGVLVKAYLSQFQEDFTIFLRCRSEEMVVGGCMVLTIMGSVISNDPKHILEIVGRVLSDMVFEGIIEEKSVGNFNVPIYCPTVMEVRNMIEEEGSFWLRKLEAYELAWDTGFSEAEAKTNNTNINDDDEVDKLNRGTYVSNYMRAVLEPIMIKHFGKSVMDDLFERFTQKIIEFTANENWPHIYFGISLTKK